MRIKMLMIGASGVGKTHLCVKIASVIPSALIDVDEKADVIIQKLKSPVKWYSGTPYTSFVSSLDRAVKSDAQLIIIDSLTETKDIIKRHIKQKILQRGEFYMGGIERKEATKIDPDTFIVSWELHPVIYDKIRDIMKFINSAGKSFILTYHPPIEKASAGELKMLKEIKRVCNMVVSVNKETVTITNDLFCDRCTEMSSDDFVEYVQRIITSEEIDEICQ